MSVSQSDSSAGSSFASSDGGSSLASDNTDSRALNSLNSGSADDETDDLDTNNKSVQEGLFATLYTLTKNRHLDSALWVAALKVVLEFLQIFRVLFKLTFPWHIQQDLWIFVAIQWLLFRLLVVPKGIDAYLTVFYLLMSLVLGSLLATIWVAVVLKGNDANGVWLNRLISGLQIVAMIIYTIFWPAILDYFTFMFDCKWSALAQGSTPFHLYFPEQSCIAMPHLVYMLLAGFMAVVVAGMTLVMSAGTCDLNPLTRSWLSSADAATSSKLLALKIILVAVGSCLDDVTTVQVVLMLLAVGGISSFLFYDVPYYNLVVNMAENGLWGGQLYVASLLAGLYFTNGQHTDEPEYAERITWAVLYGFSPVVGLGAVTCWLRMASLRRLTEYLHVNFKQRKAVALAANNTGDNRAKADAVVSMMTDLKTVYRWRDVKQVSIVLRGMRKWDEDGIPDPSAAEFGEFILKCAMARMPSNPSLLVMYANFLIEVRKDGQAARTQMQLAQKSNPSVLDSYNVYVAQQLAKALKREGDSLDLLSYVEFQRNYRSCVRAHKLALIAQRQFWNSLLRDSVSFVDLLNKVEMIEVAEQRATLTYRRVLERYPNNGKVLKVYGRFLEFVRNDPWTAAKFYEEALKQGTTESLLAMTAGQAGAAGLTEVLGAIDEKSDGLVIINAQGIILMVNAPVLGMFGYDKGELEGKNISVLMPPPFSTHHDNFLRRFVETGVPHIANKKRDMIALHKDRSIFPIMLCATRLSGVGADMLFMGLVRRLPPANADGKAVVRFWTTSTGMIMCTDRSTVDNFGLDAATLVGQSFSNLCTNVEEVNSYMNAANKKSLENDVVVEIPKIRTQVLHSYLPPVETELSIQFGGALDNKDDCRTICIQACVLSESAATLVLDHKARVVYATDKLCAMLGYPVTSLLKMDLGALLPQPYSQLYKPWISVDVSKKTTPSSCLGGGVVHILAANGAKLPVTLKISTREDPSNGHVTYVVQVTKSSELAGLDQRRMLLSINHKGTILEVNRGAPKALFGFEPTELVGRPLAAIVDVFGLWRHQFGDDESLMALLASLALEEQAGKAAASGASWRVGVHLPVKHDEDIAAHAGHLADDNQQRHQGMGNSNLLLALQQRDRLRAACMNVSLLSLDDQLTQQLLENGAAADTTPVLQVSLFRADALGSVIELDKHLAIVRADESVGLMFGVHPRHFHKKPFAKLVGLPDATTFDELLGSQGAAGTAKKGAMKGGAAASAAVSRVGQVKHVTAHHLGDGKALMLEMQAVSYCQGNKTRLIVRLQLREPCSASLAALTMLKEGKDSAAAAMKAALTVAGQDQHKSVVVHSRPDSGVSKDSADGLEEKVLKRQEAPNKLESFDRTSDWVREQSELPKSQNASPTHQRAAALAKPGHHTRRSSDAANVSDGEAKPSKGRGRHRHSYSSDSDEDKNEGKLRKGKGGGSKYHRPSNNEAGDSFGDEAAVYLAAKPAGEHNIHLAGGSISKEAGCKEDVRSNSDAEDRLMDHGHRAATPNKPGPGSIAESASVGGSSGMGDGASEMGSMSEAAGGAHDEDVAVDARRAKRLKKLNRMVQSAVAQVTATTWRRHTLYILGILLLVHVVFFAVLTTQVDRRYANAKAVNSIAKLLFNSLLVPIRCNFIQKCWMDQFSSYPVCNSESMKGSHSLLRLNTENMRSLHHQLFLGEGNILQPFQDQRLVEYWGYKQLVEAKMLPISTDGTMIAANGSRTLWEMGNNYVTAARDVYFWADKWQASMLNTTAWNYVYQNGPGPIYTGYAWSLDTFVDYSWNDLTAISLLLIVLVIVEVVVVQLGCMAYEFYLLQQCNVSHMRLFTVFLALPSATVRLMAQRQLQVDDDSKEELDDDDMELADMATAGAATAGTGNGTDGEEMGAAKKSKSVRLAANVEDDTDVGEDGADDSPRKKCKKNPAEGRPSGKAKSKPGAAASSQAANNKKLTGVAAFKHSAYKLMFGWLDPKFKRNGKKLVASTTVLWMFMVPLLLWVVAVVAIFASSYSKLQGLQGPLASLDVSAHVMYRLSRVRLAANLLAFSENAEENAAHRKELTSRLERLQAEYNTLLYGGVMLLAAGVEVSFDAKAPASVLDNPQVADLFFKTTDCLRVDQSTCYPPGHELYTITHSGIDAMMNRYLDNMRVFAALPDKLALANHSTYEWSNYVVATDMVQGLDRAGDIFVRWTISRLESVKQLHIILLVITLAGLVLFIFLLYQPYVRRLKRDIKAVAGLLSQLPAEVDVEAHVKTVVLGFVKPPDASAASVPAGAHVSSLAVAYVAPNAFTLTAPGVPPDYSLPMLAGAPKGFPSLGILQQRRSADAAGTDWYGNVQT